MLIGSNLVNPQHAAKKVSQTDPAKNPSASAFPDDPSTVLWIYRYIPLFSFIIYSLNYFLDIFLILLFKSCYLEATDIFLRFSH